MDAMKRWGLTILCLVAALGCYGLGIPAGSAIFLLLGVIFEIVFWVRLYKHQAPDA